MKLARALTQGAIVVLALVLGTNAGLAGPSPMPDVTQWPAVIRAVLDCRATTDGQQRLACFDAAVAKLDVAGTKGDVVVVDHEQIRTMKRQAFGLSLPSLSLFTSKGRKDDVDTQIEVVLTSTEVGGDGHRLFTFEDGATWRQVDQTDFAPRRKPGTTGVISRGLAGSYFLSLDRQPGVRVQRQR
jgi:hypothetical protein